MILRFALPLAGAILLTGALPGHDETNALGAASPLTVKPQTETAGPTQLFPPLPSLASLPPSATDQTDETAPVTSSHHSGKKTRRASAHKVIAETTVHLVVSDASQAYLTEVERKLDDALRNVPRDPRAPMSIVSVALTR